MFIFIKDEISCRVIYYEKHVTFLALGKGVLQVGTVAFKPLLASAYASDIPPPSCTFMLVCAALAFQVKVWEPFSRLCPSCPPFLPLSSFVCQSLSCLVTLLPFFFVLSTFDFHGPIDAFNISSISTKSSVRSINSCNIVGVLHAYSDMKGLLGHMLPKRTTNFIF